MSELGSLMGRWHQWRRAYSVERGYARVSLAHGDDDDLEQSLMRAIDAEITKLPADLQLALQHFARAECMGVEVIFTPRLGTRQRREALVERAVETIQHRLLQIGVM